MIPILVLFAVVLGAFATLQSAGNGLLAGRIGLGATVLCNALTLLAGALALWLVLPRPADATGGAPWWLYLCGLFGLAIVTGCAFLFPRLGAGPTVGLLVAAQLGTALAFDHFGVAGERLPVTAVRLCGAVLMVAGATLILWPRLTR